MLSADEQLNEQVLWQMREGGDDLAIVRPIKYQLVFSSELDAQTFATIVRQRGMMAEIAQTTCSEELPWDVNVTLDMQPELVAISSFEREIGRLAAQHGGRNDGWYCERIVASEP